MNKLFIEQYRPTNLSEVVGNEQVVQHLQYFVANGNLPNLLFTSPPGVGKTTIAHCVGRQMLGDQFKQAFIELNASDERNITDIRERVKTFAQLQITLQPGKHKIVFLDECDSMTSQAQMALRRIMEDYGDSTRFLLACNTIQKVIEPLQSRCCVISLQIPTAEQIAARLAQICQKAEIAFVQEGLMQIAALSEGDVRNAVNNLQTVALTTGRNITVENVKEALDFINLEQIEKVLELSQQKFQNGWACVENLLKEGFSAEEVVNAFYRYGMDTSNKMTDTLRAKYLKCVAQTHGRVAGGIRGPIQLARLLADLTQQKQ